MSKKILVVDDDETYNQMVQYWLQKNGYETDICLNGGIAFDAILEGNYDLVLLDFFLPSLQGDEICQNIRKTENIKNTAVVIMTAHTEYPTTFFTDQGAADVLYKPVMQDDLMNKVRGILGDDAS